MPKSGGTRASPQANPSRNVADVGDIFGKYFEVDGNMLLTRYVEENHTIHANQQPNLTFVGPNSSTKNIEPNKEDVQESRSKIGSLNNGIHLFSVPITFGSQNTILHGNGDGSHNAIDMGPRNEGRIQVKDRKPKLGQSSKGKTQVRSNRIPMQVEPVAPNSSGKKTKVA
nr:hypothetical protein CFP56_30342 [Quercus suber]